MNMSMKKESLSESLEKLEAITEWFERQESVDVEAALERKWFVHLEGPAAPAR